jgi:DHA2 family multidrug resistance protein
MGNSMGISVIEAILVQNTSIVGARLSEGLRPDNPLLRGPDGAFSLGSQTQFARMYGEVTRQASMVAYIDVFHMMIWVSVACAPLLLLVKPFASQGQTKETVIVE